MKYKSIRFIAIIIFAFCLLFCSCAKTENRKEVKIAVADSLFFTCENAAGTIERGGDYIANLEFLANYEFASCDYADYSVQREGTLTKLVLRNVTRPARVTVQAKRKKAKTIDFDLKCTIFYDFNGGRTAEGKTEETVNYTLHSHMRPNTEIGIGLEREGYVLVGWNMAADGSGEHVGLGSRVTVKNERSVTLYAEWRKSIAPSLLSYKESADGSLILTGYRGSGNEEWFVIPAKIEGKSVTEIASSFTTNMRCGSLASKILVLPDTIRRVSGNSFWQSSFSELYFSDNIEEISEKAFPYNMKTLHINARRPPCFQKENNSVIFADNMDRLILNRDKRKLIFFSGCSFAYGLDGERVNEVYGDDYVVFNMGMNGDINGAFQMEIMLGYMGEGDVFVHAPEEMSPSQLMAVYFVNSIMFIMVEGNYDLLALADFSENGGVLRAFFEYLELKDEATPCSYSDGRYCDFDIYGDFTEERAYDETTEKERDVTYSDDKYCYEPELITDNGVKKLVSYYDRIRAQGGEVFLSYAPVNTSARQENEIREMGYEFADKFESSFAVYGYRVISAVDDYMFPGRYFYDSDYHLNDLGAALRTERLLGDLAKIFAKGGEI